MPPEKVFATIWDILVEHAGARADEDNKATFIDAFTTSERPATEWRFQGSLGFGGKFYRDGRYRIACYREDATPERVQVVERVNRLLATLPYFP